MINIKLYQYDDIKKLNQALGSFAKNGVKVEKVETLTVDGKLQHFILADPKEVEKQKVESKIEEDTKKSIKEVKSTPIKEKN